MNRHIILAFLFLALLPGCSRASDTRRPGLSASNPTSGDGRYEPIPRLSFDPDDINGSIVALPGASYYLARLYEQSERVEEMEQRLMSSWQSAPEPWRRSSLIVLLDHLLEGERYAEVIDLVERHETSRRQSGDDDDIEVLFYGLEALYREQRYASLLDRLVQLDGRAARPGDVPAGRWLPAIDAALWRAVASFELQTSDWPAHFHEAFSDHRASAHHSRLFLYATAKRNILPRLDRSQSLLVEARYHLADGRTAQSARLFRALIDHRCSNRMQMSDLLGPALLPDIGRAFLGGGDWRLSIGAVERLIAVVATPDSAESGVVGPTGGTREEAAILARLYEYKGRLHRSAGDRQAAFAALARSASMDARGPDRDRVFWYILQSAIDSDPSMAIQFLEQQGREFHNPQGFSGLLDTLASRLVQRHDWETLAQAVEVLDGIATPGSLAQYQVITATAMRFGLLEERPNVGADLLFGRAASQWENPYYALVAAAQLGEAVEAMEVNSRRPAETGPTADNPGVRAYVAGYFRFGLDERGYQAARGSAGELTSATLARFAATLADSENYIDSMRLMDIVSRRERRVPTRQQGELMYPLAFPREMGAVIRSESLEPEIFYALVREESYFSVGIASHVGAVGLAQLMPATAAEVARAMRLQNPNLIDPATNLSIGGRYFRGLIDRFGSVQHALLGYNAGPTRIRRWNTENGVLPPVLFQEAVPFLETRHYIRKIFVTAVQYGRLYGEISPQQVYEIIFTSP